MLKKLYWFLFVYDISDKLGNTPVVKTEPFKKRITRDIARLTLISYLLLILSPLLPVLADVIAHTFWEKEHLKTVHQVSGNNHLHFELVNAEKQSEKGKTQSSFKFGSEDYAHTRVSVSFNFSCNFIIKQACFRYRSDYPASFADDNFRPPRLS